MIITGVMTMVDEGLHDGQTYEDLHVNMEMIKTEMLSSTAYMITIIRRHLRQSIAPHDQEHCFFICIWFCFWFDVIVI